jgi:hypothetical protein
MKGDKEIFVAILEPFIVDPATKVFKKQRLDANGGTDDVEVEELPDTVNIPVNQYCY